MNDFSKKICIVGAGGCGRDVACCLQDCLSVVGMDVCKSACFLVDDKYYELSEVMGMEVIRRSQFNPTMYNVVVAIGDSKQRKKVVQSFPQDTTFTTIIHPSTIISRWVEIGKGSVIAAGSILTCNIKIGMHAQININTTITHDFIAGDYFTTAPSVNISGNCTFGECVYLGTNSSTREKVSICSNAVIGMGSVVVKNIVREGIYVGNPAERLR